MPLKYMNTHLELDPQDVLIPRSGYKNFKLYSTYDYACVLRNIYGCNSGISIYFDFLVLMVGYKEHLLKMRIESNKKTFLFFNG